MQPDEDNRISTSSDESSLPLATQPYLALIYKESLMIWLNVLLEAINSSLIQRLARPG